MPWSKTIVEVIVVFQYSRNKCETDKKNGNDKKYDSGKLFKKIKSS